MTPELQISSAFAFCMSMGLLVLAVPQHPSASSPVPSLEVDSAVSTIDLDDVSGPRTLEEGVAAVFDCAKQVQLGEAVVNSACTLAVEELRQVASSDDASPIWVIPPDPGRPSWEVAYRAAAEYCRVVQTAAVSRGEAPPLVEGCAGLF